VKKYPTWIVAGRRFEGLLTLDELANASGFTGEARPASPGAAGPGR
jgi:hypothetical protein